MQSLALPFSTQADYFQHSLNLRSEEKDKNRLKILFREIIDLIFHYSKLCHYATKQAMQTCALRIIVTALTHRPSC